MADQFAKLKPKKLLKSQSIGSNAVGANTKFAEGIDSIFAQSGLDHNFKKYGKKGLKNSKGKRVRKFEAKHGQFQEQENKPKKGMQILSE